MNKMKKELKKILNRRKMRKRAIKKNNKVNHYKILRVVMMG